MNKIIFTELKLLLREPAALFFSILLPVGLMLVLGSIPAFRKPSPDLGGMRIIDNHFPAMMTMLAVMTLAFAIVPATLALYREKGVLRRMSTTPVHPGRLLGAQLLINAVIGVVAALLMIVLGGLVHDVPFPRQFGGFVVAFVLGSASLFAIGLVIAAMAGPKSAPVIGNVIMFPLMFVGGMWMPRETMPEFLQRVGDFLPVAPFGQAIRDTWAGAWPQPVHLVVMLVTLVAAGVLAVRLFRWE
ncbi:ABC transporter permease [Spongiactinospora sp. TRM90649]|uniref:ABC transporter permease n=1 Tax=Spongiactinospora sp. TRM90649 TaxID=3031114 RepID=UPI0023F6AEBC|nr:ABC transporter permease [Spongiactinospora sp. TRM90649]MDF5756102.1 ABC transporter permease [Spongiactinospora sp. TRM90649]